MSYINPAKDSVQELIKEDYLNCYAVRFDVNDEGEHIYDLDSFVNALMYELTDFAFGGEYWKGVTPENATEALSEAAKALYRLPAFKQIQELCAKGESLPDEVEDNLLRKGEFGELILFFLLKNFHGTIPLLSKIYFKDTDNANVHGFDAVHYHEPSKALWLGESKCYQSGKAGVNALIKDIKDHVKGEYLKREFVLVGKKFKLAPSIEESKRDEILSLLNSQRSLEQKISTINLPLLCTFPAQCFSDYTEQTAEFLEAYKKEMKALHDHFIEHNDHPLKDRLNIVLLLMPVKSKTDLVTSLHNRLASAQAIIT